MHKPTYWPDAISTDSFRFQKKQYVAALPATPSRFLLAQLIICHRAEDGLRLEEEGRHIRSCREFDEDHQSMFSPNS